MSYVPILADIADSPPPVDAKLGSKRTLTSPRLKASTFFDLNGGVKSPPAVHRSDRKAPWRGPLANAPDPSVTLNANVARWGAGCCVLSAILHRIQHARYHAGLSVPHFTGDDALRLYHLIEGYEWNETDENGNNPTDLGSDPNKCFEYWRTEGIPLPDGTRDYIAAFLEVDHTIPALADAAVYEFDGAFRGLGMPASAQGQAVWHITDPSLSGEAAPGSWGGHEVYEVSYDRLATADESWGEVRLIKRGFNLAYTDQLTVVLNQDVIGKSGVSDLGFNYDKLNADLPSL